jgi:glyoxylase-like metal-dependent hydrolase (beta-lactamase superfamily II)
VLGSQYSIFKQATQMKQWQIGKVRITQVVELGPVPTSPRFFFHEPPADLVARHAWLKPHFANDAGKLLLSIHCFIIESAGRRIVVDTCVGNDKSRSSPAWNQLSSPFLHNLSEAGFPVESIDTVLCTHLHVDHVGWNTRWVNGQWVPTFAKARYLFARKEWEHWSQEAEAQARTSLDGGAQGHSGGAYGSEGAEDVSRTTKMDDILGDSVKPIMEAGLADLVETNHQLTDEVWLEPTPGHTPGHVSVRIQSEGQHAVITGDLIHHPIQCSEPDRPVNFDSDPSLARQTRRRFLACCAEDRTLVFGTHFASPTAGHVVVSGEAWRFQVE